MIATDESVTGPTGSYDRVVKTEDTTPLEPGLVEHKWYAPGVGTVQEQDVKGGDEKVTLVKLPVRDGQGVSTTLPVARRSSRVSSASAASSRRTSAPTAGRSRPTRGAAAARPTPRAT